MKARIRRRSMFDTGSGLNLTPLLDIIFNLIFFFVLATNIKERERYLDLTLPSSGTAEERTTIPEIPEIVITADGKLFLNSEEVTMEVLESQLAAVSSESRASEAMISYDAGITMQRFVDVADICRRAGVLEPMLRLRTPDE